MLVHQLFRLAPIAVRLIWLFAASFSLRSALDFRRGHLWLLLNGDLTELATTKATLGATQVLALLPLDLEELQGYMYPPAERPN